MWLRSVVEDSAPLLLCVAGELLIAATTASRRLDVVVMSACRPAGLVPAGRHLFLLSGGLDAVPASAQVFRVSDANSAVERRRRRLHFTLR